MEHGAHFLILYYPNPTRSGRGPASAGLDRGFRPVEGLNRQNFSDLLPAKQFCCRPGQLLIICAGGVGLRKSKMSSWRQGDDEKASMQGPVPTVQRNGNRRFVTTVSGRLLLFAREPCSSRLCFVPAHLDCHVDGGFQGLPRYASLLSTPRAPSPFGALLRYRCAA